MAVVPDEKLSSRLHYLAAAVVANPRDAEDVLRFVSGASERKDASEDEPFCVAVDILKGAVEEVRKAAGERDEPAFRNVSGALMQQEDPLHQEVGRALRWATERSQCAPRPQRRERRADIDPKKIDLLAEI